MDASQLCAKRLSTIVPPSVRIVPIHVDLTSTSPSQSLIGLLCLHSVRVYTLKIGRFDGLRKLFCLPLASLKTLEVATPDEWSRVLAVRSAAREFIAPASLTIRNSSGALAFRGSRITHLRVVLTVLSGLGCRTPQPLPKLRALGRVRDG